MSKSGNMLRTRRKDNNVKPNRRLDRKSSRGMIYENEELRLKTININAEVERGQSDIKKLKRENDQLRKEIWYLRDEYEKLDKLLRDKDHEYSSSSTSCTSDSESCSSCTEESQEVETSQNLENVQKTNLKNLHTQFDHLSVVPEENSTENSEKNSTSRTSVPNDSWNIEQNVIKPDQSYPEKPQPKHFFSPIKTSKFDECPNNQFLGPELLVPPFFGFEEGCIRPEPLIPPPYPEIAPLNKSSTDLIVKIDNQNFNSLRSQSTFSNGGNLEELLNDIETISQDILKISKSQNQGFPNIIPNYDSSDVIARIQNGASYVANSKVDNYDVTEQPDDDSESRPYKSELNVVLMPTPMPLIGFDKYRNLGSSESLTSKSVENLSASHQNLRIIPDKIEQNVVIAPDSFYQCAPPNAGAYSAPTPNCLPSATYSPNCAVYAPHTSNFTGQNFDQNNPFYFGNLKDGYQNSEYFHAENLSNFEQKLKPCNSKTNLLTELPAQNPSENDENLRFKASKPEISERKDEDKDDNKKNESKTPKLSIRRKVSIHFKGKKDKTAKNKSLENLNVAKKGKSSEKKHSLFDIKFSTETKSDKKPSSGESKNSSEAKHSSTEPKNTTSSSSESKILPDNRTSSTSNCDSKPAEHKQRKSISASPERKHVHVKTDPKKGHKKHKKSDKVRNRRSTLSTERVNRERSFSVCTDRSYLDQRLGLGSGFSMYDEFMTSDRERTNSLSSCDTIKTRKMSNISNVPMSGKIPWCGCWGNGCV